MLLGQESIVTCCRADVLHFNGDPLKVNET